MPPTPSSPKSRPPERRKPSLVNVCAPSSSPPNGYAIYHQSPPQSPQAARSIPQSPTSPRQSGAGIADGSTRLSGDFASSGATGAGSGTRGEEGGGGGAGLGSLADELANAWDDDAEGEDDVSGMNYGDGGGAVEHSSVMGRRDNNEQVTDTSFTGAGDAAPANSGNDDSGAEGGKLRPPQQKSKANLQQQRHRRHESMYDGSDYGNDSDFEDPGDLPPGLEARMAGLDSLVRESEAASGEELINRAIQLLRDLGGQAGIENGTTRLITAHSSLTSHMTHQIRTLQTLTHPLLFAPFPTLSPEDIDDLIGLVDDILPNMPLPTRQNGTANSSVSYSESSLLPDPLHSLQSLLTQTSDINLALRALSDTLHESRQLTNTASRRLKSVRELVAEMRREEEGREESTRWIEKGEWDRRLADREAGKVCGEVVSGFEAVCGEWRARLFGSEVAVA